MKINPQKLRISMISMMLVILFQITPALLNSIAPIQAAAASSLPGAWRHISQPFTPRDKFGLTCESHDMYLFGGREDAATVDSEPPFVNTMYHFNTKTKQWREIFHTGDPPPRFVPSFHRLDKEGPGSSGRLQPWIYVFGGNIDTSTSSNDIWKYDIETEEWSPVLVLGNKPTPRTRFSSVKVSGHSFVTFFGLLQAGITNEVWSFDVEKENWKLLHNGQGSAPVPSARFDPACQFVVKWQKTYCFAGTSRLKDESDLWSFHHLTNVWRQITPKGPIPAPRRLAMSTLWKGEEMLVLGGWDSIHASFHNDTTVHRLDLASETWNNVPQPVTVKPRDSGQLCSTEDGVYIVGGSTQAGRENDIWRLEESSFSFVEVLSTERRPPRRAGHNALMIGQLMIIAFGRESVQFFHDIWSYHVETTLWKQASSDAISSVAGRSGACAASVGSVIYFFGGLTAGGLTNEFLSFSLETKEWKTLEAVNPPQARSSHQCAMIKGQFLMFGGAFGSSRSNQIYIFEFGLNVWKELQILSDSKPQPRSHFSLQMDPSRNELLVLNGFANFPDTVYDRWKLHSIQRHMQESSASHDANQVSLSANKPLSIWWTANFTPLLSRIPLDLTERFFIRGEGTVVGYDHRYLICGGSISTGFPAPRESMCYQYNGNTGENTLTSLPEISFTDASGVYFGRSAYFFGGRLATGSVKRKEYLDTLHVFEFNESAICAASAMNDTNCIACSRGTLNPTCQAATAGSYITDSRSNIASLCPPGTFSETVAAATQEFCKLCPIGAYNDKYGATICSACAVGTCDIGASTSYGEIRKDGDGSSFVDDNEVAIEIGGYDPDPYVASLGKNLPDLLIVAFLVLAALGVAAVIFAFVRAVSAGTPFEMARQRRYFPQEGKWIDQVFQSNAKEGTSEIHGSVLNERGLQKALADIFSSRYAPTHYLHLRPWKAPTPFDIHRKQEIIRLAPRFIRMYGNGTDQLDLFSFRILIATLVQSRKIPPLLNTVRHNSIHGKWFGWFHKLDFAPLDSWPDGHRLGDIGHQPEIYLQQTKIGGMLSLSSWIIAILVIAFLWADFHFNNLEETRGTLPLVVSNEQLRGLTYQANINATVVLIGGTKKQDCINEATGACAVTQTVSVRPLTFNASFDFPKFTQHCHYDPSQESCTKVWMCEGCSVRSGSEVALEFNTAPRAFASEVHVEITTTTGLEVKRRVAPWGRKLDVRPSFTAAKFQPLQNNTVFKGFPPTSVRTRLTPTYYASTENSYNQKDIRATGYHNEIRSFHHGNPVNEINFNQYFGVPVFVEFEAFDVILSVEQKPKQTQAEFIASILGAASGLQGFFLAILRLLDQRDSERVAEERKKMNEERRKQHEAARELSVIGAIGSSATTRRTTVKNINSDTDDAEGDNMMRNKISTPLGQKVQVRPAPKPGTSPVRAVSSSGGLPPPKKTTPSRTSPRKVSAVGPHLGTKTVQPPATSSSPPVKEEKLAPNSKLPKAAGTEGQEGGKILSAPSSSVSKKEKSVVVTSSPSHQQQLTTTPSPAPKQNQKSAEKSEKRVQIEMQAATGGSVKKVLQITDAQDNNSPLPKHELVESWHTNEPSPIPPFDPTSEHGQTTLTSLNGALLIFRALHDHSVILQNLFQQTPSGKLILQLKKQWKVMEPFDPLVASLKENLLNQLSYPSSEPAPLVLDVYYNLLALMETQLPSTAEQDLLRKVFGWRIVTTSYCSQCREIFERGELCWYTLDTEPFTVYDAENKTQYFSSHAMSAAASQEEERSSQSDEEGGEGKRSVYLSSCGHSLQEKVTDYDIVSPPHLGVLFPAVTKSVVLSCPKKKVTARGGQQEDVRKKAEEERYEQVDVDDEEIGLQPIIEGQTDVDKFSILSWRGIGSMPHPHAALPIEGTWQAVNQDGSLAEFSNEQIDQRNVMDLDFTVMKRGALSS